MPQTPKFPVSLFPVSFPAPIGFPVDARLLAPDNRCAYLHSRSATIPAKITALEAWNAAMARPLPGVAIAFKIRDAISARFNVERIGGFSGTRRDHVEAGEKLDFFLVEEALPHRLMLSARDTHLDVMTCVTAMPALNGTKIAITSSVITHNRFGRAYMIPVGPAHRIIVYATLRRIKRHFAD